MAERRMFTKKITDDENFMTLSSSAQALYLHLSMCADDDGFSNQVSVCMFKAHASVQDLQALLEKRYIYQFENGVIVIKHWRMANALRKDRYTPTVFKEELSKLCLKDNGSYTMTNEDKSTRLPFGCHVVADCLPQDSIGKYSKDKINEVSKDTSCAVPKHLATAPVFIEIPLNDGTLYSVLFSDVEEWKGLYPAVDVEQQLRSMKGWSDSNPTKRKTKKGIRRFINSWLTKEQDKYHGNIPARQNVDKKTFDEEKFKAMNDSKWQ